MIESVIKQSWACLARLCMFLARTWPTSLLVRCLLPAGVFYVLYQYLHQLNVERCEEMRYHSHWVPRAARIVFTLPVFLHCKYLVVDKASGFRQLMYCMGMRATSLYLGNLLSFMLVNLVIFVPFGALVLTYFFEDSLGIQRPGAALLLALFYLQLTAFTMALSTLVKSQKFIPLLLLMFVVDMFWGETLRGVAETLKSWQDLSPEQLASDEPRFYEVPLAILDSVSPFETLTVAFSCYLEHQSLCTTRITDTTIGQSTQMTFACSFGWSLVLLFVGILFDYLDCPAVCSHPNDAGNDVTINRVDHKHQNYFEEVNTNREVGIEIRHLSKSFTRGKPVVDNLSFDVYKGETTLLLGHNGAGKTTLMSMLLRRLRADSGTVRIGAQCLGAQSANVGFCPQDSILDEYLTVRQHLWLFSTIKLARSSSSGEQHEQQRDIEWTLKTLGLANHAHKVPGELSGGMRRKLSLAMAFVGNSKVLVLDEPSSGLDPDSRVFIWDAIRANRLDKTVLLSTQHMEEAEYLRDRVAIMSEGRIICCGSSLYLNEIFGSGYKLRIECEEMRKDELLSYVRRFFAGASIAPESNMQPTTGGILDLLINLVPSDSVQTMDQQINERQELKLVEMLADIETREASEPNFVIISHGLRSSSVEDVFLKTHEIATTTTSKTKGDFVQLPVASDCLAHLKAARKSTIAPSDSETCTLLKALVKKMLWTYRNDLVFVVCFKLLVPMLVVRKLIANLDQIEQQDNNAYVVPTYSLTMLMFHYVHYPSLETLSKFKTMQLTTRATFSLYWLAHMLVDLATICVQVLAFNLMFQLVLDTKDEDSLVAMHCLGSLALLMAGVSGALMCYLVSIVTEANAIIVSLLVFMGPTVATSGYLWLMNTVELMEDTTYVELWDLASQVLASFSPVDSINLIFYGLASDGYLVVDSIDFPERPMSPVLQGFLCLGAQILVYSAALHLIERFNIRLSEYVSLGALLELARYLAGGCPDSSWCELKSVDDELDQERQAAHKLAAAAAAATPTDKADLSCHHEDQQVNLVCHQLVKSYPAAASIRRAAPRAVNGLSLTVARGECFGLLGVNGAGKSTTFAMVAAESKPNSGAILFDGACNRANRHKLGFDPQVNPMIGMSSRNALHLMARLRLIAEPDIPALVEALMLKLGMVEHADKPVWCLSGGTKRKLSLAMSLVGYVKLLALDEPTAGIDPFARREIWHLLQGLRSDCRCSILISSHAMEECEAICDRIAIMSSGRLRCLGTFLQLRAKFAPGCKLRVQFKSTGVPLHNDKLVGELERHLASSLAPLIVELADKNANSATFTINACEQEGGDGHAHGRYSRSRMFVAMREFKTTHKLADSLVFTINDSSLEDVFKRLAQEQTAI